MIYIPHPASSGTRFHFKHGSTRTDPRTKVLPRPSNSPRKIAQLAMKTFVPWPTIPGNKRTREEA